MSVTQQPPEPLAALAAIEAEIDAIRAEVRDTAQEWQSLFLWHELGKDSISEGTLSAATSTARALVAREEQLAERRRALNERLAPAAPQSAPAEPVKAKRGEVIERVASFLETGAVPEVRAASLAAALGLNESSVAHALRSLAEDGVLERSGRGIFVVRGAVRPDPALTSIMATTTGGA